MLNKNSSAGTAAQNSFKCSLLQRPAIILAMLLLCAVFPVKAQIGKLDSLKYSGSLYASAGYNLRSNFNYPIFKDIDTVKCLFLEIVDSVLIATKWSKGYVVRKNGLISFGEKTKVGEPYLPITSGIVLSEIMYMDRSRVKNNCLQIVMVK